MGSHAAVLTMFGIASLVLSWVYLIILSFRNDYAWGFMSVFVPPLSYLYALFNLGKAWEVLALALIGLGFLFAGLT